MHIYTYVWIHWVYIQIESKSIYVYHFPSYYLFLIVSSSVTYVRTSDYNVYMWWKEGYPVINNNYIHVFLSFFLTVMYRFFFIWTNTHIDENYNVYTIREQKKERERDEPVR